MRFSHGSLTLWRWHALSQLAARIHRRAVLVLEEICALAPAAVMPHLLAARAYLLSLRDLPSALRHAKHAVHLSGAAGDARASADRDGASTVADSEDEEASEAADEADPSDGGPREPIEADPRMRAVAYELLGLAQAAISQDPSLPVEQRHMSARKSLRALYNARMLDTDSARIVYHLARQLAQLREIERAADYARHAAAASAAAGAVRVAVSAVHLLALLHSAQRDYACARQLCEAALADAPDDVSLYVTQSKLVLAHAAETATTATAAAGAPGLGAGTGAGAGRSSGNNNSNNNSGRSNDYSNDHSNCVGGGGGDRGGGDDDGGGSAPELEVLSICRKAMCAWRRAQMARQRAALAAGAAASAASRAVEPASTSTRDITDGAADARWLICAALSRPPLAPDSAASSTPLLRAAPATSARQLSADGDSTSDAGGSLHGSTVAGPTGTAAATATATATAAAVTTGSVRADALRCLETEDAAAAAAAVRQLQYLWIDVGTRRRRGWRRGRRHRCRDGADRCTATGAGEAFLALGQLKDAEAAVEEAGLLQPESPEVPYMRGRIAEARGLSATAALCYETALHLDAQHVPSLLRRAAALCAQRHFDTAEHLLRIAVGCAPLAHEPWHLLSLVLRLRDGGDVASAADCLLHALDLEATAPVRPFSLLPTLL